MTVYTEVTHDNHLSQCLPTCEKAVINPSKNLLNTLMFWIERSHQRRQLAKLDDIMLKDVGLSRADVNREINKSFWR